MSPKNKKIEDKIASIGNYVSPKVEGKEIPPEEEVKEETPPTEAPTEEIPPKEKFEELTPEQLKEKIIKLVSEIASRGLTEEERQKFIDDFKFFNGVLFELLDISNSLKGILSKTPTLTPGQALLAYFGGTAILLILLRPDLQTKIFKTKPKPETKPPKKPIEETSPEIMEGEIPKKAPEPKILKI